MTINKTLKDQILFTKKKTESLIANFPSDKWFETPNELATNLNWQIGHIILANYLHGIASISGPSDTLKAKVNIADFIKFYGPNSIPANFINEKPSSEELVDILAFSFKIILDGLEKLEEKDLDTATAIPNPSVNTKYEALMWMPQHQSWHNGQIAVLKRMLNE